MRARCPTCLPKRANSIVSSHDTRVRGVSGQTSGSQREEANQRLVQQIKAIHAQSRQTYGSPRVCAALRASGQTYNRQRVARLMRLYRVQPKRRRQYKTTTQSKHAHPVAANELNRDFHAAAPNRNWVADITYVPTREGWLYLAVIMDLFSRKIIGWAMDSRITTELTCAALQMALATRMRSRRHG